MYVPETAHAFDIVPAEDVPLHEQALAFTDAFEGYVGGTFTMSALSLARFFLTQGIDLCYSRFLRSSGDIVGFVYVNRTGDLSRLAAMGTISSARRRGVGALLVKKACEEAKARGDTAVMLEVIEQNPAAHGLYRRAGFHNQTKLLGWRRSPQCEMPASIACALETCSIANVLNAPATYEYPALPWQVSRHALAKLERPETYRFGSNHIVISFPTADAIRIHALSSSSQEMDWMGLRQMLGALLLRYKDHRFFAPPVFPQEFGTLIFQPLGFSLDPLSQFLMRLELSHSQVMVGQSFIR